MSSTDAPAVGIPDVPDAETLLRRVTGLVWILVGVFFLDRISLLLADYWLFESLDLAGVFWTNFRTGVILFGVGLVVGFVGVAAAAYTNPVTKRARMLAVHAGLVLGLAGGYYLATHYQDYLMVVGGTSFGEVEPVFEKDIGFFVFTLPAIWTTVRWLLSAVGVALLFSVGYAHLGRRGPTEEEAGLGDLLGRVSTPLTLVSFLLFSFLVAAAVWLERYDVLLRDNSDSGIFTGVSYIDATGLFSTVNYYLVTSVVVAAAAVGIGYVLHLLRERVRGRGSAASRRRLRVTVAVVAALVCFDLLFRVGILVREVVAVSPNEPVIQLDYIERHVDATRAGYDLEGLEEVDFLPAGPGDPVPDADSLLASPSLASAPLWPGFVSNLEQLIDPQHAERILQTVGDPTVYGPTREIFRQQQKLRTYYDFLDIDADRYTVEGTRRLFVNGVRELPLIEPQPWLAWWGQRFVLFTHGWGLVMAPAGEATAEGEPRYAIRDIPAKVTRPQFDVENPRVYYGEGARSLAYSNVREMREFDFPTEQGRAEIVLPDTVPAGIRIDSFLKRVVFGWNSRQLFDIVFSRLIGEETRVHIYRTPLDRVEKVAPFLYLDSDPFAFLHEGRIRWMVNGITYTDRYPNSRLQELGDKSAERAPIPRPTVRANYVRDAVKATVDAYTGQLRLYRLADEPILDTWARIYPDLFEPMEEMPRGVREHLQYPVELFHTQFDDIYILYQMDDPMTFFNMEDMWDDGDEVLGPMLDQGKAITFSIEPYHWMAGPGSRFALSMLFTPENALNLRGIPTVYQDPGDYGRIVVRRVPKGHYFTGPEQADAAIDQHPEISRFFDWWNRRGMDVIRGHTTGLVIGDEVLYVEPVFLRSRQNPVSQLKRVCVVFRGEAYMRRTLEEAVRAAVDGARAAAEEGAGRRTGAASADSGSRRGTAAGER